MVNQGPECHEPHPKKYVLNLVELQVWQLENFGPRSLDASLGTVGQMHQTIQNLHLKLLANFSVSKSHETVDVPVPEQPTPPNQNLSLSMTQGCQIPPDALRNAESGASSASPSQCRLDE